jgi:hypothetical protein
LLPCALRRKGRPCLLPALLLATPTRYSRPELLNTSETTEFILDFSTGVMTGG